MKKRFTVELTSEQIAFVIRMLHYRISMSDDEAKTAESVINALIGARQVPDTWQVLARKELRKIGGPRRPHNRKPRTRRQP